MILNDNVNVTTLFRIVRRLCWLALKDSRKNLKCKSKVFITVHFFFINSSGTKIGLPMPQHKHNFMIESDKPNTFVFSINKKDIKSKKGLDILVKKYYKPLELDIRFFLKCQLKEDSIFNVVKLDVEVIQ